MPHGVAAGVLRAAAAMADARDPWWIIGSAAIRLHGIDTDVADIDVLASARDAAALGGRVRDEPGARFRSCLARIEGPGLAIEVMGGLRVRHPGAWVAVNAGEAQHLAIAGEPAMTVPVAGLDALSAMLALFGREKDERRAAMIATRRPDPC